MSFLYPRTISISRQSALSGIGAQPYQALNIANETILFSGIAASIQSSSEIKIAFANLPGDTAGTPDYFIFISAQILPINSINNRDIITDDLNKRYQVTDNYWDSLGYRCKCELLQN